MNLRSWSWLTLWALIGLGFTPLQSHAASPLLPATAAVEAGQWRPQQIAFGHAFPFRETALTAPFSARIIEVKADIGDRVLREQVLIRFEAPDLITLLTNLHNAQQEIDLATRRADALSESLREKAVTRSTKLEADIALGEARNLLADTWQALDHALLVLGNKSDHVVIKQSLAKQSFEAVASSLSVVRAPFDGLLVDRQVGADQILLPGTLLFRLEDLATVYIEVGVQRDQVSAWREGAAIAVVADEPMALTLVSHEPRLDTDTGLWLLRFVADNPNYQLRDGAWLKVRLLGPSQAVVWVPKAAVVARDGKTYCVRKQGDTFEAVEVLVGSQVDRRVPVLSGLDSGDQVATEGAYELLYRDVKELMKFVD